MNEEQLIGLITETVIRTLDGGQDKKIDNIPVGVSARHVHLTREHVDILFGKGYELKKKKMLGGGQFAAEEQVTLIGTSLRTIEFVRVLGPERSATQVEISKTDSIKLGIKPPIRDSGDLKGSAPITIAGPGGTVHINEGCIIAKRHIHVPPDFMEKHGISDMNEIEILFKSERGGILSGATIRTDGTNTLEAHIDTDEANAMDVLSDSFCTIIAKKGGR